MAVFNKVRRFFQDKPTSYWPALTSLQRFLRKSAMAILAISNKTYFYWPFQRQIQIMAQLFQGWKTHCREGPCKSGHWSHGHSQGKSRLPKPMWGLSLRRSFWGEEQHPLDLPSCMVRASRDTAAAAHFASQLSRAHFSINPSDFKWHREQTSFSSSFFFPLSPLPINQRRKDQMDKTTKW